MNCCSIVEAPCTEPLRTTSWMTARAIPRTSIPLLVRKRLSSIEITASLTMRGICEGETITRSCWLTIPIGRPRSSSSTELRASLSSEKRCREGRSEATAIRIPKMNETRPSSSTATRIAKKRSLFRRGRALGWMSLRSSSLISAAKEASASRPPARAEGPAKRAMHLARRPRKPRNAPRVDPGSARV